MSIYYSSVAAVTICIKRNKPFSRWWPVYEYEIQSYLLHQNQRWIIIVYNHFVHYFYQNNIEQIPNHFLQGR